MILILKKNKSLRRRFYTMLVCFASFAIALAITLRVFNDNIVFFLTPTDLKERKLTRSEFRVGGVVVKNSIKVLNRGEVIEFRLTDLKNELRVRYSGVLPSLFAENQGAVALGSLVEGGVFIAKELFAKHDENYKPAETIVRSNA